jgi:hypothetical protein
MRIVCTYSIKLFNSLCDRSVKNVYIGHRVEAFDHGLKRQRWSQLGEQEGSDCEQLRDEKRLTFRAFAP